jgi:hypothetical protein
MMRATFTAGLLGPLRFSNDDVTFTPNDPDHALFKVTAPK